MHCGQWKLAMKAGSSVAMGHLHSVPSGMSWVEPMPVAGWGNCRSFARLERTPHKGGVYRGSQADDGSTSAHPVSKMFIVQFIGLATSYTTSVMTIFSNGRHTCRPRLLLREDLPDNDEGSKSPSQVSPPCQHQPAQRGNQRHSAGNSFKGVPNVFEDFAVQTPDPS